MKWININQKLPPEKDMVIGCDAKLEIATLIFLSPEEDDEWIHLIVMSNGDLPDDFNITHWMEIPEFPKERL